MRQITLLILLLGAAAPVRAQADDPPPITVTAEVDHAFVTIGDEVEFKLSIVHHPDLTVKAPRAEEALKDFEIKRVRDFSGRDGDRVVEGKIYTITTYELGEYVVNPVAVSYQSKTGERSILETPKLYLTVESVDQTKDPKTDIRGIKGVLAFKGPPWIWILSSLVFLAGAGAALWNHARRKTRKEPEEASSALTAHDEAYQALNRLAHSEWLQRAEYKLYFLRMSEIMRRYFERRFQVHALELTTGEVIANLKSRLSPDQIELVREILSFCDLVKFAKLIPTPPEILAQNQTAKRIIDQTREALSEAAPVSSRLPPVHP